jgi:hypothetical protein
LVNASLNWASIVGIVLAVGGALLFFLRNFKPAIARDTDVFFAAVGLLCGGILFFQGWRLDPILQFGQFLLAGTTVFFAYESVRLRGITTEQARRSSFFEEEEVPPLRPRGAYGGGYDREVDRFEEPEPIRRRIRPREEVEEDFYRPRRTSRPAIPERAASRRDIPEDWESPRRAAARPADDFDDDDRSAPRSRYSATGSRPATPDFGARRREREAGGEGRRGSRPIPATDMPRSSRRGGASPDAPGSRSTGSPSGPPGVPQGSPIGSTAAGPAAGTPRASGPGTTASPAAPLSDADYTPIRRPSSPPPASGEAPRSRDNRSRFDD